MLVNWGMNKWFDLHPSTLKFENIASALYVRIPKYGDMPIANNAAGAAQLNKHRTRMQYTLSPRAFELEEGCWSVFLLESLASLSLVPPKLLSASLVSIVL